MQWQILSLPFISYNAFIFVHLILFLMVESLQALHRAVQPVPQIQASIFGIPPCNAKVTTSVSDISKTLRNYPLVGCLGAADEPHCPARRVSRCLSTARFESINLSTQFCIHVSSLLASFPDEIDPVTHFLKHVSVNSWTDFWTWVFCPSFCRNTWSSRWSLGVNFESSSVLTLMLLSSSMLTRPGKY